MENADKIEKLVKLIKSKIKTTLESNDKQKILKYIALIIISFQVDNIYTHTINKSGIVSILKIFGFNEDKAEKIKSLCNNGVSLAVLTLLVYKNLIP